MTRHTLHLGDCLEVLHTMPDCSVDSVVTDPPYGLRFMGKAWDYDVPTVEVWREVLRVLKPGGHLLAFAGTRTQHRMAVNIEDAGFEIRDMIAWVYGSGFPKSLDVSKAIDKRGGSVAEFAKFRDAVKAAMRRNGVSRQHLQDALGNFMLSHYLTAGSQPAVPVLRDYRIIRDTVGLGHDFDELFNDEAEREVVGQGTEGLGQGQFHGSKVDGGYGFSKEYDITAPATPEAQQWAGWGTALKPSLEPVTVARRPLEGTVAENVLRYGTGGINIDACKVEALTGQRPSGKITAAPNRPTWEPGENLCSLCAKVVKNNAKQQRPATKDIFAASLAEPTLSAKDATIPAAIGKETTGCCVGLSPAEPATNPTDNFSLNTDVSGKTQMDLSRPATKSTISTATASTTDLKTCSVCGCLITDQSTSESTPTTKNGKQNMQGEQESVEPPARWPANLIHDGSDEVVRLFPADALSSCGGGRSQKADIGYSGGWKSAYDNSAGQYFDTGSAARFFYTAKADKKERKGSKHPTVKPLDLMRYLCRLVTPPGGIVLDPYCGSGTTLEAALAEGFLAIGIERDPESYEDTQRRLDGAQLGLRLEVPA